MAAKIVTILGGITSSPDPVAMTRLHDSTRRAKATASEAAPERRSYMATRPTPSRWRARWSISLINSRSLPTPWPEPVRSRLTDATEALGEAFDKTMRALGAALTAGAAMPATAAVDAAFASYAKRWAGCAGRD